MRQISVIILCLGLCACDLADAWWTKDLFMDDLAIAREAGIKRDWQRAERLLERYLREEHDSEKRWQAWNLLLQAINAGNQDPHASLECLEAMLVEYDDNEDRLAHILSQMGEYNESLRYYDRAANVWSAYSDLAGLPVQNRAGGLRRLAQAQLGQRHFDAAEATLQQCLSLPLPDRNKAWCMLDLAEVGAIREQWQEVADLCQQILDSDPDSNVAGFAGYLRGDALEQLGEKNSALEQFEQTREKYPNPAVMDNRIEWLKKQLKAKSK